MEILKWDVINVFTSLLHRQGFNDALLMINGIGDSIPPPSAINELIFKVLMVNCDENIAKDAQRYLLNYVELLPKKSADFHYDYRAALEDKENSRDIWCVFKHLVKSSFHQNTKLNTSEPVKHPNCDILIKFYADMLIKYLSLDNDLFEDDLEDRFPELLSWLNEAHKVTSNNIHEKSGCSDSVYVSLHTLVENKLNSDISSDSSSMEIESIATMLIEKCPDIFNDPSKMSRFFSKCDLLPSIQLSVTEHKICELVNQEVLHNTKHCSLTLDTIIYKYFFIYSERDNMAKTPKSQQNSKSSKSTISPKSKINIFSAIEAEDDTKLHVLCRQGKMADLLEVLLTDCNLNINAKNSYGHTPMHVACAAESYHCVKFLIEEKNVAGTKVDLLATDNNGLTPLHNAAFLNNLEIAKMLLKHGGNQLTMILDQFGEKAITYTKNKNLQKELEDAENENQPLGGSPSFKDLNKDNLSVATFTNKEAYSMFLYLLNSILNLYFDIFNLRKYKKGLNKLSHKDGKCPHYLASIKNGACDYDVSIMEDLADILECFMARIQRDADAINIVIRKDLALFKFWQM